jgi:hypothetical protein
MKFSSTRLKAQMDVERFSPEGKKSSEGLLGIVTVFGLLTLLLRPWRNIVCQDDGAYAYSVLQIVHGTYRPHPMSLSSQWVQFGLVATLLKILPFFTSLAFLNFVTWLVFLLVVALAFRGTKWNWRVVSSFFLMPHWPQYGASFLYEVYNAALLIGLILVLESKPSKFGPKLRLGFLFVLSALLPLQQQSLAVFPFFWGSVSFLKRRDKVESLVLMVGPLFGLAIYALIPKGAMQAGFFIAQVSSWKSVNFVPFAVGYMLKLTCGMGLFVLPLLDLSALKRKHLAGLAGLQLLILAFFWTAGTAPIGAGVLFMDYMPRMVDLGFVSFGVWGLWVVAQAWKRRQESEVPLEGTLLAALVLLAFNIFRTVNDIRYMLILSIPMLFTLKSSGNKALGSKRWVVVSLFAVAVVTNLYNLNTNEKRWETAAELEASGISPREISAGFGRDIFTLGFDCASNVVEKLKKESKGGSIDFHRSSDISSWFNARPYELGWQPRELIKPAVFFGMQLSLRQHTSELQQQAPKRLIPYTVLGIPQALAVYESDQPRTAWCFQ